MGCRIHIVYTLNQMRVYGYPWLGWTPLVRESGMGAEYILWSALSDEDRKEVDAGNKIPLLIQLHSENILKYSKFRGRAQIVSKSTVRPKNKLARMWGTHRVAPEAFGSRAPNFLKLIE